MELIFTSILTIVILTLFWFYDYKKRKRNRELNIAIKKRSTAPIRMAPKESPVSSSEKGLMLRYIGSFDSLDKVERKEGTVCFVNETSYIFRKGQWEELVSQEYFDYKTGNSSIYYK